MPGKLDYDQVRETLSRLDTRQQCEEHSALIHRLYPAYDASISAWDIWRFECNRAFVTLSKRVNAANAASGV